jgi:hypothetical protein
MHLQATTKFELGEVGVLDIRIHLLSFHFLCFDMLSKLLQRLNFGDREVSVLIGFNNHTLFLCASFFSLCLLGVLMDFCEVYKGQTWGKLEGLLISSFEFTHWFFAFY